MTTLRETLQTAQKEAMRAKESQKLGTIRLILAAIKQREVDERITLTDEQILQVLDKMLKQRRESIAQYEKADRSDLADNEKAECTVIQAFLPTPLDEAEVASLIKQAINDTGAASIKDMGKVMGLLKPKMQGRADMGQVSQKIKAALNG